MNDLLQVSIAGCSFCVYANLPTTGYTAVIQSDDRIGSCLSSAGGQLTLG